MIGCGARRSSGALRCQTQRPAPQPCMLQWCLVDAIGAVVSPVRFNYWCGTGLWEHSWPGPPLVLCACVILRERPAGAARARTSGRGRRDAASDTREAGPRGREMHTKNKVLVPNTHTHTHTDTLARARDRTRSSLNKTMQSHTGQTPASVPAIGSACAMHAPQPGAWGEPH